LLQRQDLDVFDLESFAPELFAGLTREEKSILENRVRYEGYIRREKDRLEQLRAIEGRRIPEGFDYAGLSGLSHEVIEVQPPGRGPSGSGPDRASRPRSR
jgi:tRNA uridine 5-carboxymethylaminomethyl modification enzyme